MLQDLVVITVTDVSTRSAKSLVSSTTSVSILSVALSRIAKHYTMTSSTAK